MIARIVSSGLSHLYSYYKWVFWRLNKKCSVEPFNLSIGLWLVGWLRKMHAQLSWSDLILASRHCYTSYAYPLMILSQMKFMIVAHSDDIFQWFLFVDQIFTCAIQWHFIFASVDIQYFLWICSLRTRLLLVFISQWMVRRQDMKHQ